MQATEILFSLGGRLVNVMCLFICIVILILIILFLKNKLKNIIIIHNHS